MRRRRETRDESLHAAGRQLSLRSANQCVVDAPHYDFAFQEVAFFTSPIDVGETSATLSCTWDTSDRTMPTRWGEGSLDEMCTVFLFVSRRSST